MSSHFMPRENHCSAFPGGTGFLLLVREEVGYLGSIPPLNLVGFGFIFQTQMSTTAVR